MKVIRFFCLVVLIHVCGSEVAQALDAENHFRSSNRFGTSSDHTDEEALYELASVFTNLASPPSNEPLELERWQGECGSNLLIVLREIELFKDDDFDPSDVPQASVQQPRGSQDLLSDYEEERKINIEKARYYRTQTLARKLESRCLNYLSLLGMTNEVDHGAEKENSEDGISVSEVPIESTIPLDQNGMSAGSPTMSGNTNSDVVVNNINAESKRKPQDVASEQMAYKHIFYYVAGLILFGLMLLIYLRKRSS